MKFYQPLNLPFESFNKDQIISDVKESFDPTKLSIWKIDVDRFTKELHSLVESLGCNIFYAELFHTPPRKNLVWHIDTEVPSDIMRINFVWGSNNQFMQWGDTVEKIYQKNIQPTVTGTVSINFKEHQVRVIESYAISTPTIVHVGVPHRVVNYDTASRFCLSINLHKGNSKLMFAEAVDLFSEYVLD